MYVNVTGFLPGSYQGNNESPPGALEDLFLSIVSLSENLHLEPSGHSAGNRGLDLSTDFTIDIDNATRSGAWDMGADEAIPGGLLKITSWREIAPQ